MAIFGFRTRSPERDDATDTRRFDRLARVLDEISDEVSMERSGLERRYASETTDAAFLVEAIENDGVQEGSQGGRVEELTSSIINCERRLDFLSRQTEIIDEIRKTLSDLAKNMLSDPKAPLR